MFNTRTIALELPAFTGVGYGTLLGGDPKQDAVYFTYIAGKSAVRLGKLNVRDGTLGVSKGLNGLLADAIDAGEIVLVLTDYALHEVQREPFAVTRKLKMPKFMHQLHRVDENLVAVTRLSSRVSLLIECSSLRVVSRIVHATDLVISGHAPVLCSFQDGVAVSLNPELKRISQTKIPVGRSPVLAGDFIYCIKGAPTTGDVPEPLRVTTVLSIKRADFTVTNQAEHRGLESLCGLDSAGRLVALAADGLRLLSPETLEELARLEIPGRITAATWLPPATAAFALHPQLLSGILVVRWV